MSGGGKGGKETTKVELPKEIREAAKENMALAKEVGRLPYAPYFGPSVAAFTPGQEAAFAGTNLASRAFGLPGGAGGGIPAPENVNGFRGYSTEDLYNAGMNKVDPAILDLYNSFFFPNDQAPAAAASGSKRASGGTGLDGILANRKPPVFMFGRNNGDYGKPSTFK